MWYIDMHTHTCPLPRILSRGQNILLSNLHVSRLRIFLRIALDLWVSNVDEPNLKIILFFGINIVFVIFLPFFNIDVSRIAGGGARSLPERVSPLSVRTQNGPKHLVSLCWVPSSLTPAALNGWNNGCFYAPDQIWLQYKRTLSSRNMMRTWCRGSMPDPSRNESSKFLGSPAAQ
jgi:hypothetical protein